MFKLNSILSIWLISILFSCSEKNNQITKPNIVFLLADDMGYGDFEFIGGATDTPNMNRLAAEGVWFKNFYAAAPNCSPSRAGLLTGKKPSKVGMYSYLPMPSNHPMHLPQSETTIAKILKSIGYSTAAVGKWHLGSFSPKLNHPQPSDHGFDYFFGTESQSEPSHLNPTNFIRNGSPVGETKGYSCQILAEDSINWLKKNSDNPFFLYVAFHEPHTVVSSPPKLVVKYSDEEKRDAEYLANIDNLDLAIGKILDYLEKKNIADNTIIFFASDNGSYRWESNGGLRNGKSYLYEGGIRVPGIMRWPKKQFKKNQINTPVGLIDIVPTICDILNTELPKNVDGTSFLPLLEKAPYKRNNPLSWFFYRQVPEIAVRLGDKILLGADLDTIPRTHGFSKRDLNYIKNISLKRYELYDLNRDFSQKNNLFKSHPKQDSLIGVIDQLLVEIKTNLYPWKGLPDNIGGEERRVIKTKYKGAAWIKGSSEVQGLVEEN